MNLGDFTRDRRDCVSSHGSRFAKQAHKQRCLRLSVFGTPPFAHVFRQPNLPENSIFGIKYVYPLFDSFQELSVSLFLVDKQRKQHKQGSNKKSDL
jgi:hypothetical protein